MNKHLVTALAATSCILGSTAASAAIIVPLGSSTDFSYSYTAGTNVDVDFTFTLPESGDLVINLGTGAYGPFKFETVTFGPDSDDRFQIGSVQVVFLGAVTPDPITGGTLNTLSVEYTASAPGTFYGNYTFTAVPEPATWAMMLAGLGMIGFAVRRRRNDRVTYA